MTTNQSDLQTIKRQCKVITVQEKLAMLRTLEAGFSRREVVEMFKCSQSTISRVLSEKEGIVKDAKENVHGKRENLLYYKELDRVMGVWAREMKNSNAIITASLAKQKAEELSLTMGLDLKPSTGWLYKWKERENITFAKRIREPDELIKSFLDKKKNILIINKEDEENSKKLKLEEENLQDSIKNKTIVDLPVTIGSTHQQNLEIMENPSTATSTQTELPQHQQAEDSEQTPVQEANTENGEGKPRIKREYIKRLPIFDASGAISRSRKEKTFLTLLQKLEILERLKNGERRTDLTTEYNLSSSAMSQIVTDEEKILKLAAGGQNLHMKRIRGGIFKDGEAELNAWVQEKLELGESLTRTHIKNKAKEIAERLNIEFKASTGWLEKWKARMNLDFNENQKLIRKLPKLIPSDEDLENSQAQFELSDSLHDDQDSEIFEKRIKEEQIVNNNSDIETRDGFSGNDNDIPDVKPELLTPQQFYLQTIRAHAQTVNSHNERQSEEEEDNEDLRSEEERDMKPFIGTPPHISQTALPSKTTETVQSDNWLPEQERPICFSIKESQQKNGYIKPKSFSNDQNFTFGSFDTQGTETLHEQVLLWLNRYRIAPGAASELLNILQPHLDSAITFNPVQQNRNIF